MRNRERKERNIEKRYKTEGKKYRKGKNEMSQKRKCI